MFDVSEIKCFKDILVVILKNSRVGESDDFSTLFLNSSFLYLFFEK